MTKLHRLPVLQDTPALARSARARLARAERAPEERPTQISLAADRAPKRELLALRAATEAARAELADAYAARPATRGECAGHAGPCPWLSCRHHLKFEVTPTGAIIDHFPGVELEDMTDTCALDVADRGGLSTDEAAVVLNMTHQRLSQVETIAREKVRGGLAAHAADDAREHRGDRRGRNIDIHRPEGVWAGVEGEVEHDDGGAWTPHSRYLWGIPLGLGFGSKVLGERARARREKRRAAARRRASRLTRHLKEVG